MKHWIFLNRIKVRPDDADHGVGALLVVGCLDYLEHPKQLQQARTEAASFVDRLEPNEETGHLKQILTALNRPEGPWCAIRVYANHLRDRALLDEAAEVLTTALSVMKRDEGRAELLIELGGTYQRARRVNEARETYRQAIDYAKVAREGHWSLLAHIGLANLLARSGDLQEASHILVVVISKALECENEEIEAMASHDLGCVLIDMGNGGAAAIYCFKAFRFYQEARQAEPQCRALADIATALGILGLDDSAEIALEIVVNSTQSYESKASAIIELLEVTSRRNDRVAFQRWIRQLGTMALSPRQQVDYEIKRGTGYARFGLPGAAASLQEAVRQAMAHGLAHELAKADRILAAIQSENFSREGRKQIEPAPPELEPLIAELQELRRIGQVA